MGAEFEVQFVSASDSCIAFAALDANNWADALREVAGLAVPADTYTIEISVVSP